MEKAYSLSEKIIEEVNNYSENNVTSFGKNIYSEESIADLNEIITDGFVLYKYLVEKKYYEGKPRIEYMLNELGKYVEKLQINKENAEKLKLSNALQIWDQAKIVIAALACELLDYRDSLN